MVIMVIAVIQKRSDYMNTMVDLHCHLLPGIDDGSKDIASSLELAQQAVSNGITHVLATPHHLDNQYINHAVDVVKRTEVFQKRLILEGISLKVFPSQEIHINGDLLKHYDDLLGIDVKKHYVLLELPHSNVPQYTKQMIFDLKKYGSTPVIVHPERNTEIQENLDLLYEFIEAGALAQLTSTSYIGGFGEHVAKISDKLVKHNLVQVFASDAHALQGRGFTMREAFDKLRADFGAEKASEFENNAERLLNGQRVIAHNYSNVIKKKKFFFF